MDRYAGINSSMVDSEVARPVKAAVYHPYQFQLQHKYSNQGELSKEDLTEIANEMNNQASSLR